MPVADFIIQAIVAGVFATVILDLWQRLLHAAIGIPPTNWGLIGRWFAYMPRGRFVHRPIGATPAIAGELPLGWTLHYLIGVLYGFAYLALMVYGLERPPSFLNGLVFGAVSVVVPWFMVQPGLGIGAMGRLAPDPRIPFWTALATHLLYGISLFAGVRLGAQF